MRAVGDEALEPRLRLRRRVGTRHAQAIEAAQLRLLE
jgi:hypothetical protein